MSTSTKKQLATRHNMTKTADDYVILVSGTPGWCWLTLTSDEDESGMLVTTRDPAMALRFSNFVLARKTLREHGRLHPHRSFKLDILAPIVLNVAAA